MYLQCLFSVLSCLSLFLFNSRQLLLQNVGSIRYLHDVRKYGVFGGINSVMQSSGRLRTCCIPADRCLYSPNGLVQSQ